MPKIKKAANSKAARAVSGGVAYYTELAEYQSYFRNLRIECAIREGNAFEASLAWLKLPNLYLFEATESLARVAYIALPLKQVFITFPVRFDVPPIWNGMTISPGEIIFHAVGETFHQLTMGATKWASIALTPDFLSQQSMLFLGSLLSIPETGRIVRPPTTIARELRNVHTKACHLGHGPPSRIGHPQAGKAIEDELMQILVACLDTNQTSEFGPNPRRHRLIVNQISEILVAREDGRVSLDELCETVGVSERALRASCSAILRMGPNEYERLWRLNKVRRHLSEQTRTSKTIANVARCYGFTEPGRFAVQYRKLFGESPSATRLKAVSAENKPNLHSGGKGVATSSP